MSRQFSKVKILPAEWKAIDGDTVIEGFASTSDVDRMGDVMNPHGITNIDEYLSNPIIFYNHNWNLAVGMVTKLEPRDDGVFVRAHLGHSKFTQDEVIPNVRDRILRSMSVGYDVEDFDFIKDGTMLIKKWALYEISIVSLPANPHAQFSLAKSLGLASGADSRRGEKGALPAVPPSLAADADFATVAAHCARLFGVTKGYVLDAAQRKAAWEAVALHYARHDKPLPVLGAGFDFAAPNLKLITFANDELYYHEIGIIGERLRGLTADAKTVESLCNHHVKGGRVLSAQNCPLVENAIKALQALLQAAQREEADSKDALKALLEREYESTVDPLEFLLRSN